MSGERLKLREEEERILKALPTLLKKDIWFRREVSIVLSETLATKDDLKQILDEMRNSREESNRRFEAMDRRFEAMQTQMDRRFEAMDRRFEALVQEMHQGFELQSKATKDLETRMHQGFELQSKATKDLSIKIDTVGSRWGILAESTIRNTLKELLLKNLKVAEVKECKLPDKDGFVFGYPQEIQIDLLIKNGENYLVEIKSSAGSSDVSILHRKAHLYKEITGILPKMLFVAVEMKEEGKKSCQNLNVQLLTYDDIKD